MDIRVGDAVRQNRGSDKRIGVVLKITDNSAMWFPRADILYSDGTIGWGYLLDLEVVSESR